MAILAIIAGVYLAVRLFSLIHTAAVDVVFWDQFAFYSPIWKKRSFWQLFRYQHGPHRMGIGLNLMQIINEAAAWNQRVLAFFVGVVMCCSAIGALWLKRRIIGPLAWYDIVIPLLFLSNRQWALYADAINPSHGALPLLLLIWVGLAFTVQRPVLRYTLIGILTFIATFTGFGVFCLPAIIIVLVLQAFKVLKGPRPKSSRSELAGIGIALALCAVTAIAFSAKYVFEPAAPGFVFPHPRPMEYVYFMALEIAYLFGARYPGIGKIPGFGEMVYGCVLLGILTLYGIFVLWRIWRSRAVPTGEIPAAQSNFWFIQLLLLLFTGFFLANSAIGRVCTGLENAMTSRYVPLLMPAVLSLYFAALILPRPTLRAVGVGVLASLLALATFRPTRPLMKYYVEGKHRWVAAYLQTRDIAAADAQADFRIFPAPRAFGIDVQARLDWLKKHNLSFFRQIPRDSGSQTGQ